MTMTEGVRKAIEKLVSQPLPDWARIDATGRLIVDHDKLVKEIIKETLPKKTESESLRRSVEEKRKGQVRRQEPPRVSPRLGPADVNPHNVGPVPPQRGNSYTGKGWHGPNDSLAPRGEQTIYDVRDFSAPSGAAKFGDPNSAGGSSIIGPRGRFLGHGPHPRAGGPGGSSGVR